MRAKNTAFAVAVKTNFDAALPGVKVVPQELGRVLPNLLNNAFYAVAEKQKNSTNGYEPLVSVSTRRENGQAEIRVTDKGTGMPESVKAKIFQPFFTTKPTGQGTSLGLSLAYDIVRRYARCANFRRRGHHVRRQPPRLNWPGFVIAAANRPGRIEWRI